MDLTQTSTTTHFRRRGADESATPAEAAQLKARLSNLRRLGEKSTEIRAASAGSWTRPGLAILLQVAMFLVVGVLSTIAYAGLYLGLREVTGPMQANLLALLLTTIANTAANRRFSFGVRGPEDLVRHQLQGLAVFALSLAFTSAVLWAMPETHPTLEVAVLTVTNLFVTVLRFVAMKAWIFVRRTA